MSDRVRTAFATALSVTGTKMSDEAVLFVLDELAKEKDEDAVLDAIRKAVRECEYRLTLAAILTRIIRPVRSTVLEYHTQRTPMPDELRTLVRKLRRA